MQTDTINQNGKGRLENLPSYGPQSSRAKTYASHADEEEFNQAMDAITPPTIREKQPSYQSQVDSSGKKGMAWYTRAGYGLSIAAALFLVVRFVVAPMWLDALSNPAPSQPLESVSSGPIHTIDHYFDGMDSGQIKAQLGKLCTATDKTSTGLCALGGQKMAEVLKSEADIEFDEQLKNPLGLSNTQKKTTAKELKDSLKNNEFTRLEGM